MKTLLKISFLVSVGAWLCTSCNKDNYVEFFSTGEWKLNQYYYMDHDSTSSYTTTHENYRLNLKIGHGFTETQILNEGSYSVTGTWEVSDDVKKLRLYDTLNGTREFEVKESSPTVLKLKKEVEEWWLIRP